MPSEERNSDYTMAKSTLQVEGTVISAHPNTTFKVELDNGHKVLATLSGKLRLNYIRIVPGDRVTLEMSEYDLDRGRIVWRSK